MNIFLASIVAFMTGIAIHAASAECPDGFVSRSEFVRFEYVQDQRITELERKTAGMQKQITLLHGIVADMVCLKDMKAGKK